MTGRFWRRRSIKGQYGKHFAFYDDELRSRLLREQAITDTMESALAKGQFEVYLQPKYSLEDGTLAGAEALVQMESSGVGPAVSCGVHPFI